MKSMKVYTNQHNWRSAEIFGHCFRKTDKSGPGFARYDGPAPCPLTRLLRATYAFITRRVRHSGLQDPGITESYRRFVTYDPGKLPLAYVCKVSADFEAPSLTLYKHWNKCVWLTYGWFQQIWELRELRIFPASLFVQCLIRNNQAMLPRAPDPMFSFSLLCLVQQNSSRELRPLLHLFVPLQFLIHDNKESAPESSRSSLLLTQNKKDITPEEPQNGCRIVL